MITIDYIYKCLSEISETHIELSKETTFLDLGLDSLDIISLVQQIEDDFDIELSLSNFKDSITIKEFIDQVNN